MAAKEKAVEKCGFSLGKIEIQRDFGGNELCHCGHGERAVYRKASPRQVVPRPSCRVRVTGPPMPEIRCCIRPADTTRGLPGGSNSLRMGSRMAPLRSVRRGSLVGRGVNRVLRLGLRRGMRSIEVHPEDFRRQLADKHGLWVPNFSRMHDVPLERLDAIAKTLIRDAERLA